MTGMVAVDVFDRLLKGIDSLDRHHQGEVLFAKILLGRGLRERKELSRVGVRPENHAVLLHGFRQHGKETVRDVSMHYQRFGRVADADPLCFGIDQDAHCHIEVRVLIDVNMAVAGTGLDDRDLAVLHDRADQARSASGDQDIHVLAHCHQFSRCGSVCSGDQLHGVGIDPAVGKRFAKRIRDRDIGVNGVAAAL